MEIKTTQRRQKGKRIGNPGLRLPQRFFARDVLVVAPDLLGKILVRKFEDGSELRLEITEVEAYLGEEDLASHAHFGKTKRNSVMYGEAGKIYVYLIYGMYWLVNIVTGKMDQPQAILIRAGRVLKGSVSTDTVGSGRVGRLLSLDQTFYGEDLQTSGRIWVEEGEDKKHIIKTLPRVGVNYAGVWKDKLWRFSLL